MSKAAKIPTIGGGREKYASVRKLQKKTVELKTLLVDEIMFDGEFDLDCLTTSIPNKSLFDEDFTEHWDFDETLNKIIAEKTQEKIAKSKQLS